MKLTIDRTKWLRGEGSERSYLLRTEDGKYCCLGFFSIACGLTDEQISNIHSPIDLTDQVNDPNFEKLLEKPGNSYFAYKLMDLNDLQTITEQGRELELTSMFAEEGIEVEFIN